MRRTKIAVPDGAAEPGAAFDAVILAGGRGSRLGGVDKPSIMVGGRTLAASIVSAASEAGARRVIMVGPSRPEVRVIAADLREVSEHPAGAGPLPALRAGLAEAAAQWLVLLAADLPFLRAGHLRALLATAGAEGTAGAVMADESGRPQWLAGCWLTSALRGAIDRYRGSSLHGLLRPLRPAILAPGPGDPGPPPWLDCDTEEDLRRARAWRSAPGAVLARDEGQVPQ